MNNMMTKNHQLKDIKLIIDAREDDSVHSWAAARPYRAVLADARKKCPAEYHLMTLSEYLTLWLQTIQEAGSRACNEADVWLRFQDDRDEKNPVSFVRHPFLSTVLVDTYLTNWNITARDKYEAQVFISGKPQKTICVPPTGKIYSVNEFGLPSKTGGRKIQESETFEHRWWAFSSDQLRDINGAIKKDFAMALFGNGGTVGCFCELIKAHYSLDDAGGFYRILALPNQ